MKSEGRSPSRTSSGAASFAVVLDLGRPTLVSLEARAPLAHPRSQLRVTAERWLVPGEGLGNGDGWTIEMPRLVVELVARPATIRVGEAVPIEAHIALMCGCPITPGGAWDTGAYEVEALVYRQGRLVERVALPFKSSPGRFGGMLLFSAKGSHELALTARNRKTGNSGLRPPERVIVAGASASAAR